MLLNYLIVSKYRSKRMMDPSNQTLNEFNLNTPFRELITPEIFSYINFVFKLMLNPALDLVSIFFKHNQHDSIPQDGSI